jgi:hypothetical protein
VKKIEQFSCGGMQQVGKMRWQVNVAIKPTNKKENTS